MWVGGWVWVHAHINVFVSTWSCFTNLTRLSPRPRYLDIVQFLPPYGSHMFKVKDKKEGVRYIAVGREGVKIFMPDSRLNPSEVQ